jgi:hypothetical protein
MSVLGVVRIKDQISIPVRSKNTVYYIVIKILSYYLLTQIVIYVAQPFVVELSINLIEMRLIYFKLLIYNVCNHYAGARSGVFRIEGILLLLKNIQHN